VQEKIEIMAKKRMVAVILFDDKEDDIDCLSAGALWVETALRSAAGDSGVSVTAYSSAADAAADEAEKAEVFAIEAETVPVGSPDSHQPNR
jgi:hypothetical protein